MLKGRLAFSEEFDTDTCGDFERVHVELLALQYAALTKALGLGPQRSWLCRRGLMVIMALYGVVK